MITRYRASLGNVQLDSLDDRIAILDISYPPMDFSEKTFATADMDGYDTGDTHYEKRTVVITFELHVYNTAERNALCQKVNEWARNGGSLRTSDRSGQYLYVKCESPASIESVRDWTAPLTIVFATARTPFWLSDAEKTVTVSGKNVKGTLKMDGNIRSALVSVTVTAIDQIKAIQVSVGKTNLKLTGLSVAIGQKIVIDYVRSRYLRIRANGVSVMSKLNASSTDNLRADCGANSSVSVISDGRANVVFSGRGLWM